MIERVKQDETEKPRTEDSPPSCSCAKRTENARTEDSPSEQMCEKDREAADRGLAPLEQLREKFCLKCSTSEAMVNTGVKLDSRARGTVSTVSTVTRW